MQVPSASNSAGTALGSLAGAAIVASAPAWPYTIAAATFLGMTPVGLAGVMAVGATALVGYAVTHIAEVKNLNTLVSEYWPQIVQTYPKSAGSDADIPLNNQG